MKITNNSVFPFLFLVIVIYLLFYIFFESLLKNGRPYMPYTNSELVIKRDNSTLKNTIDPLGSKEFLKYDSTSFFYKYIKNTWLKLEKGMDKKAVQILIGKPIRIEKGLTEIWYYEDKQGNIGRVLFYEDKVISYKIPQY